MYSVSYCMQSCISELFEECDGHSVSIENQDEVFHSVELVNWLEV
jgi:hypothetical protein